MSIFRYRNDNPRDASEVADAIEFELQQIESDAPVVQGTHNYAFIRAMAQTLAEQQEQSLQELYDAAYITDAVGEELTKRARGIGVDRQDATSSTGVALFERDSPATTERSVPSGTQVATGGEDSVTFRTTELTTIAGPNNNTDSSTYSTGSTSFASQTSFTVDVTDRPEVDLSAEIKSSDSSYTTYLRVQDTTNGVAAYDVNTTDTSFVDTGAETYDVSSMSGDVTFEFRLRTDDASGTAELQNSTVNVSGEDSTEANIECAETGPAGNVGGGTIRILIERPPGIDSVTNPEPTGDPTYTLTDGTTPLINGSEEETDEELRTRALESTAIGGAGTVQAAELALENLDEVISANVFSNRSDTTTNNVSPWHTEVRVYGGNENDIAQRIHEVFPLGTLLTLEGGKNGTQTQVTLPGGDLYGQITIPFSRPSEITLDITIDVVHTEAYAGASDVKNAIVEYIGGTTTDARTVTGIGQGVNVMVNEIENVAEDVQGVDYANVTLADTNNDGNDDSTTDSDGVPVISVSDSEVATVDASNITVSETQR